MCAIAGYTRGRLDWVDVVPREVQQDGGRAEDGTGEVRVLPVVLESVGGAGYGWGIRPVYGVQ